MIVVAALLAVPLAVSADGPMVPGDGKLFGLTMVSGGPGGDDQGPSVEELYPIYEQSGASLVFVGMDWGVCEPSDPGAGASKYDFSSLDKQVFMKSAKTRFCWIGLGNAWADKIREKDPDRYWKLAEDFVTAAARHANSRGIRYFQVAGNEFDLMGRAGWAQLYVEPLKHIYKAVKAASKDNIVVAGNLSNGLDETVQALYDAGIKDHFDVLDIHAYSNNARSGVDMFQVVSAHRVMERNGDGHKKIFLGEGWGPMRELPDIQRRSHEEKPTEAELEALRMFVENGYRNMLTERDIYDPEWLLGARFFTMNDNYGQGKWKERAKPVDEDKDGKTDYILLDGYKFPADFNIEPRFFNGGLLDFHGKPKPGLFESFPPKIPQHTFEGRLLADGPIFNYVTGRPYKLTLTITNHTGSEMNLEKFGVSWQGVKGLSVDVKSEGEAPRSVAAGAAVSTDFTLTFPREAAAKMLTVIGELYYSIDGRRHFTDCWVTISLTPELEVTLLPSRLVLDPAEEVHRVGMSIINHTNSQFDGKVTFKPYSGISVKPAEFEAKIDPYGLEAFVFGVSRDKQPAPGHYAVLLDVSGKVSDWVAVEVPVVVNRARGGIKVDGRLDDWQGAASISIAKPAGDGKPEAIGRGMFAYDDAAFYAAFEIDDSKHVQTNEWQDLWLQDSVQIAIDPLMDGARTQRGGYKGDDYEYAFAGTQKGPLVVRYQAGGDKPAGPIEGVPFAFANDGKKSRYEIALPWSELEPYERESGKPFAISVLVNRNDGAGRSYVEWGGGIGEGKDPRLFIPVILAE